MCTRMLCVSSDLAYSYLSGTYTFVCTAVYAYVCVTCTCGFYDVEEYARTFMLHYSLLLSYKSTKKKLSSHTMRRNVLYVCIPTHCKHIIPLEGSKSTWSNNNKITPEYIYIYIARYICMYTSSSVFCRRCSTFRTFVDRRTSERQINRLAGGSPLVHDFFSTFSVVRSQSKPLGRVPRHFHSSAIRTSLSGFIAVTWPKELPVFASAIYCCCVVIRGDSIEETSSSHKAPLERALLLLLLFLFSFFSSSFYKHVDIRKVFQSAFLERCTICL